MARTEFVQWQKDAGGGRAQRRLLEEERHRESLPYLDRIVFRPFPDENVRLANLRTGDADALVDNPPYKDIAALKGDPSLSVRELPGLGFSSSCSTPGPSRSTTRRCAAPSPWPSTASSW